MDCKENVSRALFAFSFWSFFVIYIVMVNTIYGSLVTYCICFIIFFVVFSIISLTNDEKLGIKIATVLLGALISPIIIYAGWLYSMYRLMSRLEKVI